MCFPGDLHAHAYTNQYINIHPDGNGHTYANADPYADSDKGSKSDTYLDRADCRSQADNYCVVLYTRITSYNVCYTKLLRFGPV